MSVRPARLIGDAARRVRVNPATSRLGFRAYDRRSYFVHDDPADPKGYRGPTEFWLQPPAATRDDLLDPRLGFQVYGGLILPGTERGHHYHPHPKAYDYFSMMAGDYLVALESLAGDEQELYYLREPAVLIFPPYTPHLVRNLGAAAAPFVAFKSWNFAETGGLTDAYTIRIDARQAARAIARPLALPDGCFGFQAGERPTSQGADGRSATPGRAA